MLYQPIPGTEGLASLLLADVGGGHVWGENLMKLANQFLVDGGIYAGVLAPTLWKQYGSFT